MGSPEPEPSMPMMTFGFAAAWLVSFLSAGAACQWLGSQHAYGAHTRAQVSLAIGFCCVCATWMLAELLRILNPMKTNGHFEAVATTEPVKIGAVADESGQSTSASEQASESKEAVCPHPDKDESKLKMSLERLVGAVNELRAGAEMAAILAFMYVCDRTEIFSKAKKIYDPQQFWGCWALLCLVALCTVRKLDNAKPLQREQTDEWKGWMQLMFLMYHYFAEKEVYNAIRVYIAAYVFMTGFGNFSLYLKGKSFTVRRTMQMLFRLNFLGFIVCVGLNNEYMLYYICAMHTLFTIFVILVVYIKQDMNTSNPMLWAKVAVTSVCTVLIYDSGPTLFTGLFGTLPVVRELFAFHDPLHPETTDEMHEWHFRSGLDRFIWIIGMVFAMYMPTFVHLFDWLQAKPGMQRHVWSLAVAVAILIPSSIWVYFVFMLDKLTYNAVHPFTSAVPIAAYLLLRNLLACFRERYLFLFAFLGRYTLETYILQFHVWMKTTGVNGSPKHLLEWIPGNYYANFVLVSIVYVFLSIRIAKLTVVIRDGLIPPELKDIANVWAGVAGAAAFSWMASYFFC